ncbi:MAG: GntR family transcriptional regulator [bacterium]|jgi:GntR family transcriptional regulator
MVAKNLGLEINPKSGVPLYVQLSQQISSLITAGIWDAGFKLPTERDLAEMLGISRNTVSAAYKELEAEQMLISLQGRGTFVAGDSLEKEKTGRKGRLLKVIDLALEEAAELGFSPDDFLSLATSRALERKESRGIINLAFVGTSEEQIYYFQRELLPLSEIKILPFLMEAIKDNPELAREKLAHQDLIVTTLIKIDELESLVQPLTTPIIGIALELELETIVQMARLPEHSTLALVCTSHTFVSQVQASLRRSGISTVTLVSSTADEDLASVLETADAVAAVSNRIGEVLASAPNKEIIELKYRVDQGSLSMLRSFFLDFKKKT